MSDKLCLKCLTDWKENVNCLPSWLHCHHEPKEKAKCWCESPMDTRLSADESLSINFCPECGKKLEAE